MKKQTLINQIKEKRSFLCVGLDADLEKIPTHLLDCEDPLFEFNNVKITKNRDCLLIKLQT